MSQRAVQRARLSRRENARRQKVGERRIPPGISPSNGNRCGGKKKREYIEEIRQRIGTSNFPSSSSSSWVKDTTAWRGKETRKIFCLRVYEKAVVTKSRRTSKVGLSTKAMKRKLGKADKYARLLPLDNITERRGRTCFAYFAARLRRHRKNCGNFHNFPIPLSLSRSFSFQQTDRETETQQQQQTDRQIDRWIDREREREKVSECKRNEG